VAHGSEGFRMTDGTTLADRALALVDERAEELVELALRLSNMLDLAGQERPIAEAIDSWFRSAGIRSEVQAISPSSANVLASVPGRSRPSARPSLLLSAHLDTEGAIPHEDADYRRLRGAWREGDLLIGKGLVNDKAMVTAQMMALRIVHDLGVPLDGDLLFLGSAQETGAPLEPDGTPAPGSAALGPHVAEGFGSRWAIDRGVHADYVLVGEPTGFAISGAQAGYLRVIVSVPGLIPYTPFLERGERPQDNPNPLERAGHVITRLEEWARVYAERERLEFWGGTITPKAQIQDIRKPAPLFTEDGDRCEIYLDIRTAPDRDDGHLVEELRGIVGDLGFGAEVRPYDRKRGYVAIGADRLVDAVRSAHITIFGAEPGPPHSAHISMWHDSNAFNEVGIPAVSYGIAVQREAYTRERTRAAKVEDLARLAKVYALTALDMCILPSRGGDGPGRPG
jgi:acetylornithine deacetylase/succinyl-diaminopimelate desuccinylase-like protein